MSSSLALRVLEVLPDSVQPRLKRLMYRMTPLSLLLLYTGGAPRKRGWFKSRARMEPVNQEGDPIPWMNYAIIEYLNDAVDDSHIIFEYGSGNSSIWYASRGAAVVSIEHNREWATRIGPELPENAELRLIESEDEYVSIIDEYDAPDICIVDGKWRNQCVESAISAIADDGVIVLDDSEREELSNARSLLGEHGFKELRFTAMKPIDRNVASSSIFYREDNCLGL